MAGSPGPEPAGPSSKFGFAATGSNKSDNREKRCKDTPFHYFPLPFAADRPPINQRWSKLSTSSLPKLRHPTCPEPGLRCANYCLWDRHDLKLFLLAIPGTLVLVTSRTMFLCAIVTPPFSPAPMATFCMRGS